MRNLLIAIVSILLLIPKVQAETFKVKVASSPAVSSSGVYLALVRGYFKENNLDVEIDVVQGSSAPLSLLLKQNQIQVAAAALTSGLFSSLKDSSSKIVADKGHVRHDRDYIGLIVRKDLIDSKKVKSLSDLKGKKIALTSLDGVSQQVVLDKMLKSVNLKLADVELIKLSYPETVLAMKSKSIDASVILDPFLAQTVKNNDAVLFEKSNSFSPNQQSAAIVFSGEFINKNRAQAVAFLKAYLKGVQDYNEALKRPELLKKLAEDLAAYIKLDSLDLWNQFLPVGLNNDGQLNISALQSDLDWYFENKYLKSPIKAETIVDKSILSESLKNDKK